jgi:hypothetical protein
MEALGPQGAANYPKYVEEHFPHVLENIASCWGTPKMDGYFKELMVTGRSDRHGFPTEAADEILRLFCLHSGQEPSRPASRTDATAWDWVERLDFFDKAKAPKGP